MVPLVGRKRSGINRDLNERWSPAVRTGSQPAERFRSTHRILSASKSTKAVGRAGLRHAVQRPTRSLLEEVWRWMSGRVVPRRGQPVGRRHSLTNESRPVSPCGFPPLVDILSEGGIKRAHASVERGIPQGGKLKGETGLITRAERDRLLRCDQRQSRRRLPTALGWTRARPVRAASGGMAVSPLGARICLYR